MNRYPFDKKRSTEMDVLDFYLAAIHYRNSHKDESSEIAMHVFNKTHPKAKLSFPIGRDVNRLRDEFGALEAIGMPEDDTKSIEDYEDEVWLRLSNLVKKAKKNRTV